MTPQSDTRTASVSQPGPTETADAQNTGGAAPPGMAFDPTALGFLAPPQDAGAIGRLGKYRVLAVLGHGGMGVVFRAEDPALKRQVALKAMLPHVAANPHSRGRFIREARAQAAVEHDHIIPIFEINEDGPTPFLAGLVTDDVCVHLATMPGLKRVSLRKSKVTEAGVKKLAAALPKCRIEWDGGAIEPTDK